jgi:hypothetical protein
MSHVFISYSHQDSTYAHALAEALQQAGFDVWIDGRIDYGTAWPRVIQEHLDSCAAFIVVMTPRAYESDWVQNELNRAKRKKKPIFPLLLEGEEPWLSVEATQYIDVRDGQMPNVRFYDSIATRGVPRKVVVGEDVVLKEKLPVESPLKLKKMPSKTPQVEIAASQSADLPLDEFKNLLPDLSTILPLPFEWCVIPAGQVTIEYSESDHQTFHVPTFAMAMYPITNAQYQVFVDAANGYENADWWRFSDEARTWRAKNTRPFDKDLGINWSPRTKVCWFEALAFCRWLKYEMNKAFGMLDVAITLPTEQQWQRAGQGDDNRVFPWGNQIPPNGINNSVRDKVGFDLTNRSPFGVANMIDDVSAWCINGWFYNSIDLRGKSPRVFRGGRIMDCDQAPLLCRRSESPYKQLMGLGFRLILELPNNRK